MARFVSMLCGLAFLLSVVAAGCCPNCGTGDNAAGPAAGPGAQDRDDQESGAPDAPKAGRLGRSLHKVLVALESTPPRSDPPVVWDPPVFEEVKGPQEEVEMERFDIGDMPDLPVELDTEILDLKPLPIDPGEEKIDDAPGELSVFGDPEPSKVPAKELGRGIGIGVGGVGGVGIGPGKGVEPGEGAKKARATVGRFGGTAQSERAVAAALKWLARHQNFNGSWTQEGYLRRCTDQTCTGPGAAKQDVGTTALGLLPFLGAGQTHKSKGPYQSHIAKGIDWLLKQQKADGDLRGNNGTMYSHGLAAIVLCEAYGMTKDEAVGKAAQKAVDFIQTAQNKQTGGWRYNPGDPGDTSVGGWQLSALKSAQLAGLKVSPECLDGARKFLKSVAAGEHGEQFKYLPTGPQPTPCMTAVGLLCSQHLGAKRGDPQMTAGARYLTEHAPDAQSRNCYYWHYGMQAMHNLSGPDWDNWNRKMRRILVESQVRDGCAAGSWDPAKPVQDVWGQQGGRIMVTSLSALVLEVYYRYLPLFKLDNDLASKPAEKTE